VRIVHRVACSYEHEIVQELRDIGLECPRTPVGMGKDWLALDIDEADPRWPAIKAALKEHDFGETIHWTEFSPEEFRSAAWLAFAGDWHNGYPMPDGDFGYLNLTYDLTEYCEKCGIGAKQKAPFRLRGEPKWGTRSVMGLNWVFDEVFVRPEVWHTVFAPFGIGCRPVLAYRKETELKTVVQLQINTVLESELAMGGHPFDICEFCQRKKYLPFTRGMFPAMTKPAEGLHAVKSKEWFGSGAAADRAILVSQALYAQTQKHRLKGAWFGVMAPLAQG